MSAQCTVIESKNNYVSSELCFSAIFQATKPVE